MERVGHLPIAGRHSVYQTRPDILDQYRRVRGDSIVTSLWLLSWSDGWSNAVRLLFFISALETWTVSALCCFDFHWRNRCSHVHACVISFFFSCLPVESVCGCNYHAVYTKHTSFEIWPKKTFRFCNLHADLFHKNCDVYVKITWASRVPFLSDFMIISLSSNAQCFSLIYDTIWYTHVV